MHTALNLLGKTSFHNKHIQGDRDLYEEITLGIRAAAVDRFSQKTGLNEERISALIPINRKTLLRRKAEGLLDAKQSDRLVLIAKVYAHALNVFGSKEKTNQWLSAPNLSLNNKPPIELLKNSLGCTIVDDTLYRIEHGIYS